MPMPWTSNDENDNEPSAENIFHISQIEYLPMTHAVIQRETKPDKILSQVFDQVQNGWQFQPKGSLLEPFYSRRIEITMWDCYGV